MLHKGILGGDIITGMRCKTQSSVFFILLPKKNERFQKCVKRGMHSQRLETTGMHYVTIF